MRSHRFFVYRVSSLTSLVLLTLASLLPGVARAHSLGLSQSDFIVAEGGTVTGEITLSAREALALTTLDKDHDGTVTDDEVAASYADLRKLVVDQVEVTADDRSCAASFGRAALLEGDGLLVTATYACPPGARRVGVTLYFLSELGPAHRHAARVTAFGGASIQKVLSGTNRLITLDLPESRGGREARSGKRTLAPWRKVAVLVLTASFVVFMAVLFVWRFRATRRQTRPRGGSR